MTLPSAKVMVKREGEFFSFVFLGGWLLGRKNMFIPLSPLFYALLKV